MNQFISSRDIAQQVEILRNPSCDTPYRRRRLARMIRAWNVQNGIPNVKVSVLPHRCNQ